MPNTPDSLGEYFRQIERTDKPLLTAALDHALELDRLNLYLTNPDQTPAEDVPGIIGKAQAMRALQIGEAVKSLYESKSVPAPESDQSFKDLYQKAKAMRNVLAHPERPGNVPDLEAVRYLMGSLQTKISELETKYPDNIQLHAIDKNLRQFPHEDSLLTPKIISDAAHYQELGAIGKLKDTSWAAQQQLGNMSDLIARRDAIAHNYDKVEEDAAHSLSTLIREVSSGRTAENVEFQVLNSPADPEMRKTLADIIPKLETLDKATGVDKAALKEISSMVKRGAKPEQVRVVGDAIFKGLTEPKSDIAKWALENKKMLDDPMVRDATARINQDPVIVARSEHISTDRPYYEKLEKSSAESLSKVAAEEAERLEKVQAKAALDKQIDAGLKDIKAPETLEKISDVTVSDYTVSYKGKKLFSQTTQGSYQLVGSKPDFMNAIKESEGLRNYIATSNKFDPSTQTTATGICRKIIADNLKANPSGIPLQQGAEQIKTPQAEPSNSADQQPKKPLSISDFIEPVGYEGGSYNVGFQTDSADIAHFFKKAGIHSVLAQRMYTDGTKIKLYKNPADIPHGYKLRPGAYVGAMQSNDGLHLGLAGYDTSIHEAKHYLNEIQTPDGTWTVPAEDQRFHTAVARDSFHYKVLENALTANNVAEFEDDYQKLAEDYNKKVDSFNAGEEPLLAEKTPFRDNTHMPLKARDYVERHFPDKTELPLHERVSDAVRRDVDMDKLSPEYRIRKRDALRLIQEDYKPNITEIATHYDHYNTQHDAPIIWNEANAQYAGLRNAFRFSMTNQAVISPNLEKYYQQEIVETQRDPLNRVVARYEPSANGQPRQLVETTLRDSSDVFILKCPNKEIAQQVQDNLRNSSAKIETVQTAAEGSQEAYLTAKTRLHNTRLVEAWNGTGTEIIPGVSAYEGKVNHNASWQANVDYRLNHIKTGNVEKPSQQTPSPQEQRQAQADQQRQQQDQANTQSTQQEHRQQEQQQLKQQPSAQQQSIAQQQVTRAKAQQLVQQQAANNPEQHGQPTPSAPTGSAPSTDNKAAPKIEVVSNQPLPIAPQTQLNNPHPINQDSKSTPSASNQNKPKVEVASTANNQPPANPKPAQNNSQTPKTETETKVETPHPETLPPKSGETYSTNIPHPKTTTGAKGVTAGAGLWFATKNIYEGIKNGDTWQTTKGAADAAMSTVSVGLEKMAESGSVRAAKAIPGVNGLIKYGEYAYNTIKPWVGKDAADKNNGTKVVESTVGLSTAAGTMAATTMIAAPVSEGLVGLGFVAEGGAAVAGIGLGAGMAAGALVGVAGAAGAGIGYGLEKGANWAFGTEDKLGNHIYGDAEKQISDQGKTAGMKAKNSAGLPVIDDTHNKELSKIINSNPTEAKQLSSDPELAAKGITNAQDPAYIQKKLDENKEKVDKSESRGWAGRLLNTPDAQKIADESEHGTAQIEANAYSHHFKQWQKDQISTATTLSSDAATQASQIGGNLADKGCSTNRTDDFKKQNLPLNPQVISQTRYV